LCYTIIVKGERYKKESQKKTKKPLDKPQKVWYNPSVVRKRDRGVKKKF
jgi:hypothetical protein